MAEAETLPTIVSSQLDSITIAYGNSSEDLIMYGYDYNPCETPLNPSPPASSEIGYQSSLHPSSPSDCGSEFTDLGYNNNTNAAVSSFDDSGNESNDAEEDNDANDPDYLPLAKKTTLSRCVGYLQPNALCFALSELML